MYSGELTVRTCEAPWGASAHDFVFHLFTGLGNGNVTLSGLAANYTAKVSYTAPSEPFAVNIVAPGTDSGTRSRAHAHTNLQPREPRATPPEPRREGDGGRGERESRARAQPLAR